MLATAGMGGSFSMGDAIGAFMVCAALITLVGATGWFERAMNRIPMEIATALLAGVLARFGLDAFAAAQTALPLVLVMLGSYLVARRLWPRYAVVLTLLVATAYAAASGQMAWSAVTLELARPQFTAPQFSWSALVSLALPLFVVTMASQNLPGVAVIRATYADTKGNCTLQREGVIGEALSIAQAAKNSGGKVIVQVERITQPGTIDTRDVVVPGTLVDAIVVSKPENHHQTMGGAPGQYAGSLTGDVRMPLSDIKPIPLDDRKIICRRAAMELIPEAVINLGIGMPEGGSAVAAEEGIIDQLTATVEPGLIGGVPCGGLRFGCAINPLAIIDHPSQFDFYDGGGLDLACLGMAELDEIGNVNVSKFGPRIAGQGGFVNITQDSKRVVFCGTLTASGLEVAVEDGKLKIVSEGKAKKMVPKVGHVTFSGEYAREKGQKVLYVTERAVFEMRPEGLTLTEIAPGMDLEKDIIAQMEFKPHIAKDLKLMDARIFRDEPMGIKAEIMAKNGK